MFIFDGGVLSAATLQNISVNGTEIVSYAFMALPDIQAKTTHTLYRRMAKSLQALANNTSYYLQNQELL